MKVITSKEFKRNQAQIMKDVYQNGQEYEITFHRRPVAKLVPIKKAQASRPERGSSAAIAEAMRYSLVINPDSDLYRLPYKELLAAARKQKIAQLQNNTPEDK